MVVKRECAQSQFNVIQPRGTISVIRLERLDRVGVLGLSISAEVVEEDLNLDAASVATLSPSWISAKDGYTV